MTFDIGSFVAAQPTMMKVLAAVEALALPDCWVGAGFVRNPVWDALHGFPWSASYTDIDVVYFDAADIDPKRDDVIEAEQRLRSPTYLGRSKIRPGCISKTAMRHIGILPMRCAIGRRPAPPLPSGRPAFGSSFLRRSGSTICSE
jgi:hypothetical protein